MHPYILTDGQTERPSATTGHKARGNIRSKTPGGRRGTIRSKTPQHHRQQGVEAGNRKTPIPLGGALADAV